MLRCLVRRPLDDELTSSAWVRTCRRVGLPIAAVTKAILGKKWYPGFFQGGYLRDTAACTLTTPDLLLDYHTVFPYSTAFYRSETVEAARAAALAVGVEARGVGAVTQSVSDLVPRRRWCPMCAADDFEAWGESFWRRTHNLPGVLVCLTHSRPLRQSALPTYGKGCWTTLLPHECGEGQAVAPRPTAFLSEVARQSISLLRPEHRDGSTGWYRRRLCMLGLVSPARDVNASSLTGWVKGLAGRDLPLLGFRGRDVELSWLSLMVRPGVDVPFIPLKHVVLRAAMKLSTGRTAGALDHVPTGPRPHVHLQDEAYANRLRELIADRVRAGRLVGVTEALTELGCWASFRHGRERFPLLSHEVGLLRSSRSALRRLHRRRRS